MHENLSVSECSPVHISALYLSHVDGKETSIKKLGIGEWASSFSCETKVSNSGKKGMLFSPKITGRRG